jgi:hypothetical protein
MSDVSWPKPQVIGRNLAPSLRARAFIGRLVPQDSADEPEERLLERIKAKKL